MRYVLAGLVYLFCVTTAHAAKISIHLVLLLDQSNSMFVASWAEQQKAVIDAFLRQFSTICQTEVYVSYIRYGSFARQPIGAFVNNPSESEAFVDAIDPFLDDDLIETNHQDAMVSAGLEFANVEANIFAGSTDIQFLVVTTDQGSGESQDQDLYRYIPAEVNVFAVSLGEPDSRAHSYVAKEIVPQEGAMLASYDSASFHKALQDVLWSVQDQMCPMS